jgi:hypothetical protein
VEGNVRATYRVLGFLVAALVVVQAASIAVGLFLIVHGAHHGRAYSDASGDNAGQAAHSIGAIALSLVALLMLVVSFFARVERGVAMAGAVVGLVVLQWILAMVSFGVPVVGALHAINAFAIAGVASAAAARAAREPAGTVDSPSRQTV